jgi:hypothetical protein
MTRQIKHRSRPAAGQEARRYASPALIREAERTNAVSALRRAARRCARHLGSGCTAGILELVRIELAGSP